MTPIEILGEHIKEVGCGCNSCGDLYAKMPVWCSKCKTAWPCDVVKLNEIWKESYQSLQRTAWDDDTGWRAPKL